MTHTISCVIMILRFVFVPVKQVKKFGFGEARKKNMRNMVPAIYFIKDKQKGAYSTKNEWIKFNNMNCVM